ncbi:hypothetical protein Peur_042915 [Populus x canadensis]
MTWSVYEVCYWTTAKLPKLSPSSPSPTDPLNLLSKSKYKSRRNLKLCSQPVSLVEDTRREVVAGELEKAYFKKMCKFVGQDPYRGLGQAMKLLHLLPREMRMRSRRLSFPAPRGVKAPCSLVNTNIQAGFGVFDSVSWESGETGYVQGLDVKKKKRGVLLLKTVLDGKILHRANLFHKELILASC